MPTQASKWTWSGSPWPNEGVHNTVTYHLVHATGFGRTCESLPTPDTGFRSVCPSARTASTATSSASSTAAAGSYAGSDISGESTAVQNTAHVPRPPSHHVGGMRSSGGQTSRLPPAAPLHAVQRVSVNSGRQQHHRREHRGAEHRAPRPPSHHMGGMRSSGGQTSRLPPAAPLHAAQPASVSSSRQRHQRREDRGAEHRARAQPPCERDALVWRADLQAAARRAPACRAANTSQLRSAATSALLAGTAARQRLRGKATATEDQSYTGSRLQDEHHQGPCPRVSSPKPCRLSSAAPARRRQPQRRRFIRQPLTGEQHQGTLPYDTLILALAPGQRRACARRRPPRRSRAAAKARSGCRPA